MDIGYPWVTKSLRGLDCFDQSLRNHLSIFGLPYLYQRNLHSSYVWLSSHHNFFFFFKLKNPNLKDLLIVRKRLQAFWECPEVITSEASASRVAHCQHSLAAAAPSSQVDEEQRTNEQIIILDDGKFLWVEICQLYAGFWPLNWKQTVLAITPKRPT